MPAHSYDSGPFTRPKAIFCLIVSILMGTVFLVDCLYWNAPVELSEAIRAEACYDSFEEHRDRKNHLRSFHILFTNSDPLDVDTAVVTEPLRSQLIQLPSGTMLTLLVHPRSDTILSIQTEAGELLPFEEVRRILHRERTGFFLLSALFWGAALYCALYMFLHPKPKYTLSKAPDPLLMFLRKLLPTLLPAKPKR